MKFSSTHHRCHGIMHIVGINRAASYICKHRASEKQKVIEQNEYTFQSHTHKACQPYKNCWHPIVPGAQILKQKNHNNTLQIQKIMIQKFHYICLYTS